MLAQKKLEQKRESHEERVLPYQFQTVLFCGLLIGFEKILWTISMYNNYLLTLRFPYSA